MIKEKDLMALPSISGAADCLLSKYSAKVRKLIKPVKMRFPKKMMSALGHDSMVPKDIRAPKKIKEEVLSKWREHTKDFPNLPEPDVVTWSLKEDFDPEDRKLRKKLKPFLKLPRDKQKEILDKEFKDVKNEERDEIEKIYKETINSKK